MHFALKQTKKNSKFLKEVFLGKYGCIIYDIKKLLKYNKKYDMIRKIIWIRYRYTNMSKLYELKKIHVKIYIIF